MHRSTVRERLERAHDMLEGKHLRWLLRSHLEESIRGKEVKQRDNLDELLAGLSILHIGGFNTPEQYEELSLNGEFVRDVLEQRDVCRFYEAYYPYAPPILLREVLRDPNSDYAIAFAAERQRAGWPAQFAQFMVLDAMFNAPGPLETFLSILNSYVINGIGLADLRKAFLSEKQMERLLKHETGRKLVEGVQDFFEFSEELEEFLDACDDYPLFRAVVWLNYGYWYGGGGKRMRDVAAWTRELVGKLYDRPVERGLKDLHLSELVQEELDQADRLSATMARLTDLTSFAQPVLFLCQDKLARWIRHVAPTSPTVQPD